MGIRSLKSGVHSGGIFSSYRWMLRFHLKVFHCTELDLCVLPRNRELAQVLKINQNGKKYN